MKYDITPEEFEFFHKLDGLYRSVSLSAVHPVAVPSFETPVMQSAFAHIYYDCVDHGKRIMEYRIKHAGEDITMCFSTHRVISEPTENIQIEVNKNNRLEVVKNLERVTQTLRRYSSQVTKHQQKHGENAFLYHPFVGPGHLFMVQGYNEIIPVSFNPEVSEEGFISELNTLERLCAPFLMGTNNISGLTVKPAIVDFKSNLALCSMLLGNLSFNPHLPELKE